MRNLSAYDAEYGTDQQATDLLVLIRVAGRLIGSRHTLGILFEYYVLDGHVYYEVERRAYYRAEYFTFCDILRQGDMSDFVAANGFHLGRQNA